MRVFKTFDDSTLSRCYNSSRSSILLLPSAHLSIPAVSSYPRTSGCGWSAFNSRSIASFFCWTGSRKKSHIFHFVSGERQNVSNSCLETSATGGNYAIFCRSGEGPQRACIQEYPPNSEFLVACPSQGENI